jgi:catechol 2,3-dioxygenase-like lactoylglutathione lyase family enzyme
MTDAIETLAPHFFQVAYVVDDLEAAEDWFKKIWGVPVFLRMENVTLGALCTYRGKPADSSMHISLGYAKDVQIELIQSVRGPSLYTEFLERKGPGLHHVAFAVPNFADTVERLKNSGLEAISEGYFETGTHFAYFDCEANGASVIEILGFSPSTWEFMERIKTGSNSPRGKEAQ